LVPKHRIILDTAQVMIKVRGIPLWDMPELLIADQKVENT